MFRAGATSSNARAWKAGPILLGAALLVAACGGEFDGAEADVDDIGEPLHREYFAGHRGLDAEPSSAGMPSAVGQTRDDEQALVEDQVVRELAAEYDVAELDPSAVPADSENFSGDVFGTAGTVRFDDDHRPGHTRVNGNSSPDPIPAREAADGLLSCSELPSPELKELCLREVRARMR